MILVTGASGRFSSALLAELRARGIPAVGERERHWNDSWEAALHPSDDSARPGSPLG